MDSAASIQALHATLAQRETPETVAALIDKVLPSRLARRAAPSLGAVVAASLRRLFGWSSMPTVFRAPDAATSQADKARELALLFLGETLPEGDDPEALDALIGTFDALIGKTRGRSSFRDDRLGREARRARGLSRRRYGKLFRLAGRLERKAARLREAAVRHELVLVGKAGLSARLTPEDFAGDLPSAAFVAYYAARTKLRSEFTIQGQQRPFDALAAELLALCEDSPTASWWAIAHVFPRADVLARLTDPQRGRLLGVWFDLLQMIAERLDATAARSAIDLETMIVRRGDDSSSWNLLAGAWNRARDHWIALVEAMGMDGLLDTLLPGKVMRLMAADVAAWHRREGGAVHPDTLVWRDLPRPWTVLRLETPCGRAEVEAVCRVHGVDPESSGWSRARPRTAVAAFRPTPELVHSVSVSNPYLADYLRRVGAFSGRPAKAAPQLD